VAAWRTWIWKWVRVLTGSGHVASGATAAGALRVVAGESSSASVLARILCAAASRALMVEVASLAVGGLRSVIISDGTWRDAM
jgi:hypothetical protein